MRSVLSRTLALVLLASPLAAQDTAAVKALAQRDSLDAVKAYNASRSSTVRAAARRIWARTDSINKALRIVVTPPAPTPTPEPTPTPTPTPTPIDTAKFDGVAELPRNIPNLPIPTCQTTVRVGTDLQGAINSATPGTCLLLAPGSVFTGNFTLPNKGTSTSYITIQTDAVLPQPGTRITPSTAASLKLAKILTPTSEAAIATAEGAHHYVLRGLDIGPASGVTYVSALIRFTNATIANNLWLHQVYAHGTPTMELRRTVFADFRFGGAVDSWFTDSHSNNSDTQCWLVLDGGANQRFQNNYCAAGHEPFLAGGGDPSDSSRSPRDIAILRSHFHRPLSWRGVWQSKNMIEVKNARRMLIEGNVLENSWPDAQAGYCFLVKGENQDGTAPYTQSADVTFRYNRVKNCANGIDVLRLGSGNPAQPTSRVSIHDNLVEGVAKLGGDGVAMLFLDGPVDVQVKRNTFLNGLEGYPSNSGISFDGAPMTRAVWDGNTIGHGQYGVKGSGESDGLTSLNVYAPGGTFTNNAIVGGCGSYPATNICITSASLSTVGADLTKLTAMTAGVVVPDATMSARRSAARPRTRYTASKPACQKALTDKRCDVPLRRD